MGERLEYSMLARAFFWDDKAERSVPPCRNRLAYVTSFFQSYFTASSRRASRKISPYCPSTIRERVDPSLLKSTHKLGYTHELEASLTAGNAVTPHDP